MKATSIYRRCLKARDALLRRVFRLHLRLLGGIEVDRRAQVSHRAIFQITHPSGGNCQVRIGRGARVKEFAILGPRTGFIHVGEGSSINPFCVLLGYGGIRIGNNVRIAAGCSIVAFNHNFEEADVPIALQGNNAKGVTIEDDVWIGTGVRILDGVTIGSGSVIGAGSVVTRSIPPDSVAVGVPARVMRKRKEE